MVSKICYKFEEKYDDDCVKYIMISSISRKHFEALIDERVDPTIVFRSQSNIRKKLLRKCFKD